MKLGDYKSLLTNQKQSWSNGKKKEKKSRDCTVLCKLQMFPVQPVVTPSTWYTTALSLALCV